MEQVQSKPTFTFYCHRNIAKCLSDGIGILTSHFWQNCRLFWPVALAFALCISLLELIAVYLRFTLSLAMFLMALGASAVLVLLAFSACQGTIYRLLQLRINGLSPKGLRLRDVYDAEFRRLFLRAFLSNALIMGVSAIAVIGAWKVQGFLNEGDESALTTWILLGSMGAFLFIALWVPTEQCLPVVEMRKGSFLRNFWEGYCRGWRKWLKVFSLFFIVEIAIALMLSLLASPAVVASLVLNNAAQSRLAGDPVTLPAAFPAWAFLLFLVAGLMATILLWLRTLPQAFLFASIQSEMDEAKETELPLV